ncbi:MAG: tRNA 2-thiouridine(34) synthase MnmA [bacterium]
MTLKKRVVVGLSGGVDSSAAAALLIEQGYDVHGVYLECYNEPGCRTDQDKKDALQVAMQLGIRFQTLDFRKEYREKVVEYFYHEFEEGRTPNPDVVCNREIKFGIFYDWAIASGYDYVATGHYARIEGGKLRRAYDESKDQSYFLWQVPRRHLKHILFPLGGMLKSEVRAKSKELELATAEKPDSMGICFIGEVDVAKLLKDRLGEKPGEVVRGGEVVGRHNGLWFYTIGQRGGWEMDPKAQKSDTQPLYVIGKNKVKNQLIVGTREATMRDRFQILDVRFQGQNDQKLWVRIRNLGELYEVEEFDGKVIKTRERIFGVAGGQSAVLYDRDGVLVGGGIIV